MREREREREGEIERERGSERENIKCLDVERTTKTLIINYHDTLCRQTTLGTIDSL